MGKINFGRVVLGGLVAGLVLSIGEYLLNDMVLASQMKDYFSQHRFPTPAGSAIGIAVAITFVLGIFLILLYALIRPRLGAGPKTAVVAGLAAWFCIYFYNNIVGAALGFVPGGILPVALVWGLAEYVLAALAGAALYKEEG
jgi:hypothetical protein